MHIPCTDDLALTSKRRTHKDFKANKTFIVQFFFPFFSFLQKHAYIHKVWQVLGKTHTHTLLHARTHAHTHTFLAPGLTSKVLKTSGVASPPPCLSILPPYLPSAKLVLCGAAVIVEVGEPQKQKAGSFWGQ